MLVFADRYQDEVAGLVLSQRARTPDQSDRWLAVVPTPSPQEDVSMTMLREGWGGVIPMTQPFKPMNWDETLAQVRAVKTLGQTYHWPCLRPVPPARKTCASGSLYRPLTSPLGWRKCG